MTLLDELKRQKKRRAAGGKKKKKRKAAKKRRKKAAKKRPVKRRKKAAKKRPVKRRKKAGAVVSFGKLMRRPGKRKLNPTKTRTRIRNLYSQGELAQANKLRAKLKAAGYEYK